MSRRRRSRRAIHSFTQCCTHSYNTYISTKWFWFFLLRKKEHQQQQQGKGKIKSCSWNIIFLREKKICNAHVWFNLASLQCFARQLNYRYDMCVCVCKWIHTNTYLYNAGMFHQQHVSGFAPKFNSLHLSIFFFIAIVNLSMLFLIFLCFST